MKDSIGVQVLQAQAHLYEKFPYRTLTKMSTHLALEVLTQVAIFAQLHYNVELAPRLELLKELYDIDVVKLVHENGLTQRFLFLLAAHTTEIDLLHDIHLTGLSVDDAIYDTK